MVNKLNFFTPVYHENPTPSERVESVIDNYFYLGGKIATVQKTQDGAEVVFLNNPIHTEKSKTTGLNIFKLLSYCTIIVPLGFLIAKLVVRCPKHYQVDLDYSNPQTNEPFKSDSKIKQLVTNFQHSDSTKKLDEGNNSDSTTMKLYDEDDKEMVVEIKEIAKWLANTPIKVKYGNSKPLWDSSEEYRSLIKRLIENSTDEVKSKLETQLEAFNNSIPVVQQLESDYNFTQILKELIRDNKTEILNEIKNTFGEDERAFLFPEGLPSQQLIRLKSFLTPNAHLNEAFLKIKTKKLLEYLKETSK